MLEPRNAPATPAVAKTLRAWPFHVAGSSVLNKICQRAQGDSDGARPDGNVRILNAYDINEQRDGGNRSSAADETENEANE